MIAIKFTDTELSILDYVAHLRYTKTNEHGTEFIQSSKNPRDIVRHGVYTEYAVAKYLNVFFDLNCDFRKFAEDLCTNLGTKIDVKSTEKEGGPLNATRNAIKKPADIFIHTEIDEEKKCVKIVGYIERDELLKRININDIGNGYYYRMSQALLKNVNAYQC